MPLFLLSNREAKDQHQAQNSSSSNSVHPRVKLETQHKLSITDTGDNMETKKAAWISQVQMPRWKQGAEIGQTLGFFWATYLSEHCFEHRVLK